MQVSETGCSDTPNFALVNLNIKPIWSNFQKNTSTSG